MWGGVAESAFVFGLLQSGEQTLWANTDFHRTYRGTSMMCTLNTRENRIPIYDETVFSSNFLFYTIDSYIIMFLFIRLPRSSTLHILPLQQRTETCEIASLKRMQYKCYY